MQATATSDSLIGFTLVNKYKVLRQIGRGGMGVVYEAEHVELGKRVAVKLMLEKYAEDSEAIARFKREALAASRIGNPHIIDVADIGTAPDGRSFVVMELLIGTSLSDLMEKGGAMAPWRALQIMRQVLRAVGAAHAKKIIHRDLKPDNIFLVNQDDHHDFVKLLDFGISKVVDQAAEIAATKLTTTGMVMGTPLYMAPEQAMGAVTDHHADIYACGVILYEMLAGQPPFNGATYPILVAKLLTQDPPLLSEIRPGLPPALVAAVHRALEKEPERRFDSCDQFSAALPREGQSGSMEMAQTLDSGSLKAAGAMGFDLSRSGARSGARSAAQPVQAKLGASTLNAGQQVPSATAIPQQKRSKLPIVFGALGVGLAVGAIAIVAMSRGDKPGADDKVTATPIIEPPKPVAPPPPAQGSDALKPPPGVSTGRIHVKSVPLGAAVTIDGSTIGSSPIEMTVAAGPHHVHLELAGWKPMDADLDVAADHDAETNLLLIKIPVAPPKIVKTIKPQDKSHVEPTPPGGVPTPPPVQNVAPPPNPYEEPVKKPPPPAKGGGASTKPNPYQ